MTYIPKKDKKASNLSLALILAGIVIAAVSQFFPYRSLIQLAAIVPIVIGIQLLVRFSLSDLRYIIDDREDGNSDLIIYKKQGKREAKVCHISISNLIEAFPRGMKKVDSNNRFNYCQNMTDRIWVLWFRDGEKSLEVLLQPDEAFLEALKSRAADGEDHISFAMN